MLAGRHRHTLTDVTDVPPELAHLRSSIDNIDAALIHLLAERFKATQQVGVLKADRRMPAADPAREEAQIARLRVLAREAGLDPVFAEKFLAFVVAEVIRHHEALAETTDEDRRSRPEPPQLSPWSHQPLEPPARVPAREAPTPPVG